MSKSAQEIAVQEFFAEGEEILQRVTQTLTGMDDNNLSQDAIDSLYRDVHTLKGSAQLFGFKSIGTIAHAVEASLEPVRQKRYKLTSDFVDTIFSCLDLVARIMSQPSLDLDNDQSLQDEMISILPKLVERATHQFERAMILVHDSSPQDGHEFEVVQEEISASVAPIIALIPEPILAPVAKAEEAVAAPVKEIQIPQVQPEPIIQPSTSSPRKTTMDKPVEDHVSESNTIRVQVNLLDKLMNLVGEMVLTRNQVLQYARVNDDNEFMKLTQRLDLVTTELQDNVMRTRMQPIGSVFSKFQRLVRDLARDLGKNIELVVTGAETELDKSLIEAIKDPLTHIVRNSCDHGIEMPAVRKSNGKSETGKLTLRAYHEGGQMIIEIQDDGGGLDPARIKDKAIQKRVITAEKAATLTDKQVQELIFMPGFSTAEQVSAVSGRGVGMDVVKTNIEKIGGMVELESTHRQFMRIRLRIPLTLAIVPAMIVSCANESYAIPQVKLQELLRVDLDEGGKVEKLQGQYIYRLRDQLLPLVSLNKVISGKDDMLEKRVFNIAVLTSSSHPYGLVVDEIKDTADIVVKPLPNFLKKVDMFSGATIMGDGSVALIVDPQGISDHALGHRKEAHTAKTDYVERKVESLTTTEYLLVRIASSTYAIPLVLVHRLEEFNSNTFDHSAEELLVKYRDGLLPLLEIEKILGLPRKESDEVPQVRPVVVISKNNRHFGLAVDQIMDITQTDHEIISHIRPKEGLLGTVIAPAGDVLTVIDTYAVINKAMGVQFEGNKKAAKRAKVLLAEDTLFFVKQITKVLNEAGLEVTHAGDGEEGLKILSDKSPNYFSLVISDIEMPKMNGFEFASAVKADERFKHLPMIALTTRFKEADQERGINSGFDKYLEKLQSDTLIDTVNIFLGGKK